ncbi:uncharacterized protein LOC126743403 isoform X2 [Anthonomus grandis grandis]|nr:uncharacterized protein LOC126743403 isoform X2 [Anthonomus grandis grandis]
MECHTKSSHKRKDFIDVHNLEWIQNKKGKCDSKLSPERKIYLEKTEVLEDGKTQEVLEEIENILIVEDSDEESSEEGGVATQTDLTVNNLNEVTEALYISKSTIDSLLRQLNKSQVLSYESLQNDEEKCVYYTGLPFSFLKFCFEKIKNVIPVCSKDMLDPFQQFLLTIIKLKLNLQFKDIAYRFGISETESSNFFNVIISAMYQHFKDLLLWQDEESNCKNEPSCFQEIFHDRNTIIVDCPEVTIDKQLLSHKNQVLSIAKYQKSNFIKVLIGITVQGKVIFISKAWGGEISDKEVLELSGFLDKINQDDIVLSDSLMIASKPKLFNSAFTKENNQLVPFPVEPISKLTQVRMHMQKVITSIKNKFHILQGPIPITMLSTTDDIKIIDKAFVVLCNLINFTQAIELS